MKLRRNILLSKQMSSGSVSPSQPQSASQRPTTAVFRLSRIEPQRSQSLFSVGHHEVAAKYFAEQTKVVGLCEPEPASIGLTETDYTIEIAHIAEFNQTADATI